MITSSKRSAVAAALVLSAVALAGCGGDDDPAAESTPTPAWDSTAPAPVATEGETPAATEAADDGQEAPAADGGDAAGAPADGGTGGTAAGDGDTGGDGGGAQPNPGGADEDPPAGDPVAQPIDACTLGVEAIAALIGANPTPEDTSAADGFGPGCAWTGPTGQELVLSISTFDDWVSAADMLGGGAEDVTGLGTEAWASLGAPSNLQVAWRRDDVSVTLAASVASGGDTLVDVARIVDAALLAAGY